MCMHAQNLRKIVKCAVNWKSVPLLKIFGNTIAVRSEWFQVVYDCLALLRSLITAGFMTFSMHLRNLPTLCTIHTFEC